MDTSSQSAGKTLIDIGWLVGVWESEGWFSLSYLKRRGFQGSQYKPQCGITNTDMVLIKKVISILKNHDLVFYVRPPRVSGMGKKPKVDVIIQGLLRVDKFLTFILPYLQAKREQAFLLREFIDYRKQQKPKTPYSNFEVNIFDKLRLLNNRTFKVSSESIRQTQKCEDVLRAARRLVEVARNEQPRLISE